MSEAIMDNKLKNDSVNKNTSPESSPNEKESKDSDGISMLARVSTLSWDLVVPIVGGVLLGTYIDKITGNELRWTLSLLVLGIIIAFGNLYNLYMEHGSLAKKEQEEQTDTGISDDKEK